MGRWTSPDPLEWLDWQNGDDEEKARFRDYINNPQHFDMYAYVLNNPLSLTDPDGEAELNKEQMEKIIKESLAKATNAQTKAVDTGKLASEILKALPTDCTVKGSTLAAALKDTGVKLDGAVGSALNSANTISKSGNTVTIQSSKVTDVSVVGGTTVHIAPTVSFNIGSNAGGTTLSNITGISATSKIGFKNVTVPVTGLLITSSKTTATYRALGFDHKKDF